MATSHVLILTDSEALGSILAATLSSAEIQTHHAHTVRDAIGLLRLHPIGYFVSDFEVAGQNVLGFVPALRRAVPYRSFETIALTRDVTSDIQNICQSVGIDEVIVKPMSPRFLRERISSRLQRSQGHEVITNLGPNVVSLFETKPEWPGTNAPQ